MMPLFAFSFMCVLIAYYEGSMRVLFLLTALAGSGLHTLIAHRFCFGFFRNLALKCNRKLKNLSKK